MTHRTFELSKEQQALLPTAQDRDFYSEHGYWISPKIIPDEMLEAAEHGMERYFSGDFDSPGVAHAEWNKPGIGGLRKADYASFCVKELAALMRYPLIAASAAALSGTDGIRLWHDQLLFKPTDDPGVETSVGWHTDRQYWMSCTSEDMLTAWVGFQDVDPEGGSVSFFDRSHRLDVTGLDFFSQDLSGLEEAVRKQGFSADIMPTTMRRGQVSFHHSRTVHGSGPNRKQEARRALAIHLQPAENEFRHYVDADGLPSHHRNDDLVAKTTGGMPDYSDEHICPALWPVRG